MLDSDDPNKVDPEVSIAADFCENDDKPPSKSISKEEYEDLRRERLLDWYFNNMAELKAIRQVLQSIFLTFSSFVSKNLFSNSLIFSDLEANRPEIYRDIDGSSVIKIMLSNLINNLKLVSYASFGCVMLA